MFDRSVNDMLFTLLPLVGSMVQLLNRMAEFEEVMSCHLSLLHPDDMCHYL